MVDEIWHFHDLRWKDQERIRKHAEGKGKGKKGDVSSDESAESEEDDDDEDELPKKCVAMIDCFIAFINTGTLKSLVANRLLIKQNCGICDAQLRIGTFDGKWCNITALFSICPMSAASEMENEPMFRNYFIVT